MSPLQILDGLRSSDATIRNQAAEALHKLLTRLASIPLPSGKGQRSAIVVIPVSERADVVAEVALRIVRGIDLREQHDGAATEYFKKMLARNWLVRLRKMTRERVGATETQVDDAKDREALEPADTISNEPVADAKQRGRAIIERVMAAALEEVAARYRDAQSKVFVQLMEITFDGADFRTVIQRDDPYAESMRDTAENSAQQRHRRVRERMLEAIPAMVEQGRLTQEEADIATRIIRDFLTRCQRSTAPGIQKSMSSGEQSP